MTTLLAIGVLAVLLAAPVSMAVACVTLVRLADAQADIRDLTAQAGRRCCCRTRD